MGPKKLFPLIECSTCYLIFGQNGSITTGKEKGERMKKDFINVILFIINHISFKLGLSPSKKIVLFALIIAH